MATPHGPVLNRDWVGLRVRLRESARNGFALIAEGSVGHVELYPAGGIGFQLDKCECCSCALYIFRMHRRDFDILTPREEWKDTRGKGRRRR